MTRRSLTIVLHWSSWVCLLLLLGLGPMPILAWIFGLSGLAMCATALVSGLMSGPGPKLEGVLRSAHPWMHRAMYVALGVTSALTLAGHFGALPAAANLKAVWFALVGAGSLHGIFHLWRQTALLDGAFRRMTPKFLHGIF